MTEQRHDENGGDPFPKAVKLLEHRDRLRAARAALMTAWEKSGEGALGPIATVLSGLDAILEGKPLPFAVSATRAIDMELLGALLTDLHQAALRIDHVGDFRAVKDGPFHRDLKNALAHLRPLLAPSDRDAAPAPEEQKFVCETCRQPWDDACDAFGIGCIRVPA